jgi:hypothetical protein
MDKYGNNQEELDDYQDYNQEINLDHSGGIDNFTDINEKVRDYEKNKNSNSGKNNKQEIKDIKNVYGNNNNDNEIDIDVKEQNGKSDHTDTLDENVSVTIVKNFIYFLYINYYLSYQCRDLKRVLHKLGHVIVPRCSASSEDELKNWDLWGPLCLTLMLCM